jgi:lipopolysaccharide/colanic/teichoic acid biosynthesis glycosyltransferase
MKDTATPPSGRDASTVASSDASGVARLGGYVTRTGAEVPEPIAGGLTRRDAFVKRVFDVFAAGAGLLAFGWLILIGAAVSALAHGGSGFFVQRRVGRHGRTFPLVKLMTMRRVSGPVTSVTTRGDPRITATGRVLRRTKIDELPQLLNVLAGHMSMVGPRPDVPGFADQLQGPARIVLSVRPGITGPATLAYRDEEVLLAAQNDPERYNREVVYPDKVRINREYIEAYRFWRDLAYLWRTVAGR